MTSKQKGYIALGVLLSVTLVAAVLVPPVPQDPSFHEFVDKRPWLGIPNFGDVASNIGFLVVGLLGLAAVTGRRAREVFAQPADAVPYVVIFASVLCVTAGSTYFHLSPNHDTLLWDRLPMTLAFMAFFSAVIADRVDRRAGLIALPVLLLAGVGSVVYWYMGELAGQGDLRPYAIIQFFPMLAIPVIVWLCRPGTYTDGRSIAVIIGLYAVAKGLEVFDAQVFELLGQTVSGHSLKHLVAALASYVLYRMVVDARVSSSLSRAENSAAHRPLTG